MRPRLLALGAALLALLPHARGQDSKPASRAATRPASQPRGPVLATQSVGMTGQLLDFVLPGSELEPIPAEGSVPLVLRVVRVDPHGDAFRYRLTFQGLEPGRYDLATLLRRKDGSAAGGLDPVVVEITPVRPPGMHQPNQLAIAPLPRYGGYRTLLIAAAVFWVLGLVALLWLGRRRRAAAMTAARPTSLAEELRPIVLEAMSGTLPPDRLAALERMLLTWWRQRLGLDREPAAQAIVALRAHPEAGELLRALERWLHQPGASKGVDVNALLRPYQDLPAGPEPALRATEQSA
jgi:hypothetical protein